MAMIACGIVYIVKYCDDNNVGTLLKIVDIPCVNIAFLYSIKVNHIVYNIFNRITSVSLFDNFMLLTFW